MTKYGPKALLIINKVSGNTSYEDKLEKFNKIFNQKQASQGLPKYL